jgi:hypothetical protein
MTFTTEEQATSRFAPASAVDASVLPKSKSLASSEAIATSKSLRFDILNSLIQDIGRTQSSSMKEASEDIAGTSAQSGLSAAVETATTSPEPAAILVGTKTLTTNADGIIGTHLLRSTEPGERGGSTHSIDKSTNTLAMDGISTHTMQTSQTVEENPQAAVTASDTRIDHASGTAELVVGSHTSILATTRGIGDYVWAGIADMLSAVSVSASSASTIPTGVPSTSLDPIDPLARPVTSISAAAKSDAEIVVEGSSVVSTIVPDSPNTRATHANDELEGNSPLSNTDKSTTSRVESTAVSPSPSDLQGPSSENRSGPSIFTPSVGMCVLSLVVFVLL